MKVFITFLVATLALAAQGSYVPNVWPSQSAGWNSWNGWNEHGAIAAYPYAKSWLSILQAAPLHKGWNGYYDGANSWGLPLRSYGSGAYGWGHQQGLVKTVIPAKINTWGLPWENYGTGAYGWGHQNVVKTVIPVQKQIAVVPEPSYVAPLAVQKAIVY
ncbi:uncharacterized protein LOC131429373 [Malaya genurostris]|uniref:uncharacterized protein LOC131429373 n=1 Tax=Malaya genurostris TaxID=325434 RepID=UPI0026F3C5A3|nr:uncharacterized protein LOC131429373 [Malaya genurostris]